MTTSSILQGADEGLRTLATCQSRSRQSDAAPWAPRRSSGSQSPVGGRRGRRAACGLGAQQDRPQSALE